MIASPPSQSSLIPYHELIESSTESPESFQCYDLFETNANDAESDDLPPIDCGPRLTRSVSFYEPSTSNDITLNDLQAQCHIARTTLFRSMTDRQYDQQYLSSHYFPSSCRDNSLFRPIDFSSQCHSSVSYPSSHYDGDQFDFQFLTSDPIDYEQSIIVRSCPSPPQSCVGPSFDFDTSRNSSPSKQCSCRTEPRFQ